MERSEKRIKVLVLSGGGVFGMVPAQFMSMVPDEDLDKIDYFAGTSVGGILALCYASGVGTRETKELFKQAAPLIFKKDWLRRILPKRSLYASDGIENYLKRTLPGRICDCPRKFIVPCFNFRKEVILIFHNLDDSYGCYDLWKVGRATSAAPIFFEAFSDNILIDGGIIENCPVGIMYSTLQDVLGVRKEDIDIFVVGTGVNYPNDDRTIKKVRRYSMIKWARELLPLITTKGNEMLSLIIGKNFGFGSFNYFNPVTIKGSLDDAEQVEDGSLERSCDIYNSLFLKEWKSFLNK